MHLEDQVVHHLVVRKFHFLQRILQMTTPVAVAVAGTIGIDDKVALGVVATCGTHGVDEGLRIAINAVIS